MDQVFADKIQRTLIDILDVGQCAFEHHDSGSARLLGSKEIERV